MRPALAASVLFLTACASPPTRPSAHPAPVDAGPAPGVRLPRDVRPTAQRLVLTIDPRRDGYTGTTEIDVVLDAPRSVIWLHANGPRVTRATVTPAGGAARTATWKPEGETGLAALLLPTDLPAGRARIALAFEAPFGPKLEGLYKVVQAGDAYAFTQFEPLGARDAFPCFDEPGWKIPWDTTLVVPDGLQAITNTRELARERSGASVRIHFAATLPLPSYLVAFAIGPLDVVAAPDVPPNEVRKRPLPLRALTARGRGKEVAYALSHTGEILATLERIVGHEYPYDKLDILAVPDKGGAMENPGAVTFNDYLLLFDEKTAPMQQRRRYAGVMAHELAHQWTGNLVTAAWWDDIWLNEAFATWLGSMSADAWDPRTDARAELFDSIQGAMGNDSLVSARAIRQPIVSSHDIENAFDAITYRKGGGVLAMFERWVGPELFRAGLADYLSAHAHGVATADDFLDAASKRAGKDVKTPFHTFLDQPGVPYVEAELTCEGRPRLLLKQSRYLPLGSSGDTRKIWQVPVCARYAVGKTTVEACTLLTAPEGELPLGATCPSWVFPNADGAGYYRYSLREADLVKLRDRGFASLSGRERIAYAGSLRAAYHRGSLSYQAILLAAAPLATDSNHSVAAEPMGLVAQARDWLYTDALRARVEAYGRKLYEAQARKLGWRAQPGDDANRIQLRANVLAFLAFTARDPRVRAEAKHLGLAFLGEGTDGAIHPEAVDRDLVGIALGVLGEEAERPLWDRVHSLLGKTEDTQLRAHLLAFLVSARRPELVPLVHGLSFDPILRATEVLSPLWSTMQEASLRDESWQWTKAHFEELRTVVPRHHAQTSLISASGAFCDEAHVREVEAFFTPARIAKIEGGPRVLASTLEGMRLCVVRRAKQESSARATFGAARP